MGAYLSTPVTDKETDSKSNAFFDYGVSAMQGWRVTMEDAHVAVLGLDGNPKSAFFGVFDGHGGAEVARFCAKYMKTVFLESEEFKKGNIPQALKSSYLKIDEMLRNPENAQELSNLKAKNSTSNGAGLEPVDQSDAVATGGAYEGPAAGCTAVVAVIIDDVLYVANAGDSRCVFCYGAKTISMTTDHKPNNPEEEKRITNAGGIVTDGRVNGCLNLSRAIGDMTYKEVGVDPENHIVTAIPDVNQHPLDNSSRFLILACDGIWDMLTNEEAVDFVNTGLQELKQPKEICENMCDFCLAKTTEGIGKGCDNMSAMVVVLKRPQTEQETAT